MPRTSAPKRDAHHRPSLRSDTIRDLAGACGVGTNIPPRSIRKGSCVISSWVCHEQTLVKRFPTGSRSSPSWLPRHDRDSDTLLAILELTDVGISLSAALTWILPFASLLRRNPPYKQDRPHHPHPGRFPRASPASRRNPAEPHSSPSIPMESPWRRRLLRQHEQPGDVKSKRRANLGQICFTHAEQEGRTNPGGELI
jgi:hypothetical protein